MEVNQSWCFIGVFSKQNGNDRQMCKQIILFCFLFVVDASGAGPGDLTIVVNEGTVPSTARMIGQNIYAVSFTPTKAGFYTVELFFNDQPLKGS